MLLTLIAPRLVAFTSLTSNHPHRPDNKIFLFSANLSDMKPRKDTFEMPQVPLIEIPKLREGTVGGIRRGSIKRQSDIVREKKKSRQEEREEEKLRQASYFRKVTGESPSKYKTNFQATKPRNLDYIN